MQDEAVFFHLGLPKPKNSTNRFAWKTNTWRLAAHVKADSLEMAWLRPEVIPQWVDMRQLWDQLPRPRKPRYVGAWCWGSEVMTALDENRGRRRATSEVPPHALAKLPQ
jgi:hypothetical protein